jgi:hypothetical protein
MKSEGQNCDNGPLALESKMSLLRQFRTIDGYGAFMERYMSRKDRPIRMEICSDSASYATNPTLPTLELNTVFDSEVLGNGRPSYGTTS